MDEEGGTPLWCAAQGRHEAVVRLLVEPEDVEADSKDKDGRTPLWWAAYEGHETVGRLLEAKLSNGRVCVKFTRLPLSRVFTHLP